LIQLGGAASAIGFRLSVFGEVGSTNDLALTAATNGDPGRHWFVATAQSAGRGRGGRAWTSRPGNLFSTLLLVDPCPAPDLPKLGFVAGIAAHRAISELAPQLAGVRLKWPNDVLVDGAKLAGILLEGRALPGGAQAVAVGIGMNCRHHPDNLAYAATDLAACGVPGGPEAVFPLLSDAMAETLAVFAGGQGFAAVRNAWITAAHGIGTVVTVRQGTKTREGVFSGIDANGRLLLDEGSVLSVIDAADVSFRGSTAAR
jgi:BirA family biotin operon repressor/biotin-[acetyl-CoA-carboxylase] ligase